MPREREVPEQRPESSVADFHVGKLRSVQKPAELSREAKTQRADTSQRSNRYA